MGKGKRGRESRREGSRPRRGAPERGYRLVGREEDRLRLMYWCAAAKADEHLALTAIAPAVDQALAEFRESGDPDPVILAIKACMPQGWKPGGEPGARLAAMEG